MKIALGTVQFGLDYGINNHKGIIKKTEINSMLDYAKSNGINLLDTAQAYGKSERIIGLSKSSGFNFITKLKPGISSGEITQCIIMSCNNLNVKVIEGVLFHDFNDFLKTPKLFEELKLSKKNGLINKIGFSLYFTHELEYLLEQNISFDIIQIPFSVFDQRFKKYFKQLKEKNIEIHARSIFLQGLVFMNPSELSNHFDNYKTHFELFQKKCQKLNHSISSICLNLVYRHKEIDRVIIGVSSLKELKENLDYLSENVYNLEDFDSFKIEDENIILPVNWK